MANPMPLVEPETSAVLLVSSRFIRVGWFDLLSLVVRRLVFAQQLIRRISIEAGSCQQGCVDRDIYQLNSCNVPLLGQRTAEDQLTKQ
jgi:hypothetical protein